MHTPLIWLDEVNSTNTYAKEHFAEMEDGTLVAAGLQTAGRGRLGRLWLSPAGENIYASYVMKQVEQPFLATAVASLAVLETLREYAPGISFYLKWPNDVYCGMDKICGILSEGVLRRRADGPGYMGIIAGMGININSDRVSLANAGQATSLFLCTGEKFSVKKVLSRLVKSLSACYITYLTAPERFFAVWKAENKLIGRVLGFESPSGETFHALLHDITNQGDAVLLLKDGEQRIFSCGDVRILKNTWQEP